MTSQATLPLEPIRRPVARREDPGTSHEAARSISREAVAGSQAQVLRVLTNFGPQTDVDIARHSAAFRWTASRLRTARKELVEMGLIEDSGERRRTRSGRWAAVWRIK